MSEKRFKLLLILLGLGIEILYLGFMLYYTHGHLSVPLDDSFIFYQYARGLSEGYPFQYNAGDPPSTGFTSLLYLLVLSLGYLAGWKDLLMIPFSIGLGGILLLISSLLIFKIGKNLLDFRCGVLVSLLFLLHGPIVWGYLSGMEIGLFITLILLTIYSYMKEREKGFYPKTILSSSLLALVRPEGAILVVILVLFIIHHLLSSRRISLRNLYIFIPLSLILLQVVGIYLLTGRLVPNTMLAKSSLYQAKSYLPEDILKSCSFFIYMLKEIFAGFYGTYFEPMGISANAGQVSAYFAPFSLLFFLIGGLPSAFREVSRKNPSFYLLLNFWFFMGILAVAVAIPKNVHWHRYIIPFYPIFIISLSVGIYRISQAASSLLTSLELRDTFWGLGSFFLLFHLFSLFFFGIAYGKNSRDIYQQQMTLARWVDENLPKDAVIAVNDIGALKFIGRRKVIDLIGLASNDFTEAHIHGSGSIYEAIENLPPSSIPDYFIIYPDWFRFEGLSLVSKLVYSLGLFEPTIAGSMGPMQVYKTDSSLLNSGNLPKTKMDGFELTDSLDVADIRSEKRHHYRFYTSEPGMMSNDVKEIGYRDLPGEVIVDGGRAISGGEIMVIETKPFKGLKIITRTRGRGQPFGLRVFVNKRYIGDWRFIDYSTNQWFEEVFFIPPEYITSNRTEIKLELIDKEVQVYLSYHYWFYQ